MTDRTTILQLVTKLRALGSRTTSEAEALTAMARAEKLMQAYRIDEAELAMGEADGTIKVEVVDRKFDHLDFAEGRNRHKVHACIWELAAFCEVKCVIYGTTPRVIGDAPDVSLFEYLCVIIRDSMDEGYAKWRRYQSAVGTGAKASFQTSMATALNQRMAKMTRERNADRKTQVAEAMKLLPVDAATKLAQDIASGNIKELTSTALVVVSAAEVKTKMVDSFYDSAFSDVKLGTASRIKTNTSNVSAYSAGRAAAAKVNFGRPIGTSKTRRIA
jgi:hypothetical protein